MRYFQCATADLHTKIQSGNDSCIRSVLYYLIFGAGLIDHDLLYAAIQTTAKVVAGGIQWAVRAQLVNGDGRVNVRDARTILNYIAGMG